ncbi:MAG: hypothetical protein OFPI_28170 [Osedax symbiont Rs2]|nr:MAG: hypothetical protein OFPI_28170 [Osedax symbiont Rs2]
MAIGSTVACRQGASQLLHAPKVNNPKNSRQRVNKHIHR